VPLGVTPEGVLSVRVRFDPPKYADDGARMRAVEAIVERLRTTPGVASASAMRQLPIVEPAPMRQFTIAGRPPASALDTPWLEETAMTLGYRETFEVALAEGRLWTEDDRAASPDVGIVNREAARRYWSGQSPIGQRIALLSGINGAPAETVTIVGVVGDVRAGSTALPAVPRLYRPLAQRPADSVAFAVRVKGDPTPMARTIRAVLAQEDASLAVSEVRRFDALTRDRLRTHALIISLFTGFAAIGLVLAMAGVYGVAAFSVGQRRHEIGIRLALGADARDVVRDAVKRSFKPIGVGMAAGALGGWGVATTMRSFLFETSALDVVTYLTVISLIAVGGLLASFVPARRAASIDPGFVLKRE
jgi:putative ABC transport system permease protein